MSQPDTPTHRSFAALRQPAYRGFFFSSAGAMMADSIEHVISYWVIFNKFHSAALGGFAVLAHWLPYLLFSIHAGALTERFDARRVIQCGMLMFMAVSISWGVLFATDSLQMWHAMVLLVVHGCAGVLWGPVSQVLLYHVVSGRISAADAAKARSATTLEGDRVFFHSRCDGPFWWFVRRSHQLPAWCNVLRVNNATIVTPDIATSNFTAWVIVPSLAFVDWM